jgi:hypothetical protein
MNGDAEQTTSTAGGNSGNVIDIIPATVAIAVVALILAVGLAVFIRKRNLKRAAMDAETKAGNRKLEDECNNHQNTIEEEVIDVHDFKENRPGFSLLRIHIWGHRSRQGRRKSQSEQQQRRQTNSSREQHQQQQQHNEPPTQYLSFTPFNSNIFQLAHSHFTKRKPVSSDSLIPSPTVPPNPHSLIAQTQKALTSPTNLTTTDMNNMNQPPPSEGNNTNGSVFAFVSPGPVGHHRYDDSNFERTVTVTVTGADAVMFDGFSEKDKTQETIEGVEHEVELQPPPPAYDDLKM